MNLPELDLRNAVFWQDPAPLLAELRERTPVAVANDGTKVVLRHTDVGNLLLSGLFVNEGVSLLARRGFRPGDALYEYRRQALGALSGPDHLRIRSLVGKALGSHNVQFVRSVVERRLPALLDGLLERDIDALQTLTCLPLDVIGEYLGIAEGDRAGVDALVREGQAKAFGREVTPAIVQRANEVFAELLAFVSAQIRERRLRPRNDVLARLIEVEEGSSTLSEAEVIVLFLNLFIGATESTASALSTGLLELAHEPRLLDALRAEPALVGAFVEENLRLHPPNILIANKVAKQEIEFCGLRFAKDEPVIVPVPSPNRDPRVFERPDELDLRRNPQRHYTFSLGSHFCLGQALARAQLQAFFEVLSRQVSRVELLQQAIEWEPYAAITRMNSLRLRLHVSG
ncbi:MAG: cytochrome P450 [Nevskia sp.]|nr:cytochrome P450 [Nevskia sp.]